MASLAWTLDAVNMNNVHTISLTVPRDVAPLDGVDIDEETHYWQLVQAIRADQTGYVSIAVERPLGAYGALVDICRRTRANERRVRVRVWKVRAYADGHVNIRKHRFVEAGFVNNCFLANYYTREAALVDTNNWHGCVNAFPDSNRNYIIRGEGLTCHDLGVLAMTLYHRRRCTPFLSDQDFELA